MKGIQLIKSRCAGNHDCPVVWSCPRGAVSQKNNNSTPVIDKSKCNCCGSCTFYCPYGAFEFGLN